jgi:hypothetical protein
MMMKSKVGISCIATVATLLVGSPVFAQSFSASPLWNRQREAVRLSIGPCADGQNWVQQSDRYGYAMVQQIGRTHGDSRTTRSPKHRR